MNLLPDELASPRIRYHSKSGVTQDIGVFEKMSTPNASGYLRYRTQPDRTQNVYKEYYIPYVPVGNASASDIALRKDGVTYRLRKRGVIAGALNTIRSGSFSGVRYTSSTFSLDSGIRNSADSNGYNLRLEWAVREDVNLYIYDTAGKLVHEIRYDGFHWLWEGTRQESLTLTLNGSFYFQTSNHWFNGVYFYKLNLQVWQ